MNTDKIPGIRILEDKISADIAFIMAGGYVSRNSRNETCGHFFDAGNTY